MGVLLCGGVLCRSVLSRGRRSAMISLSDESLNCDETSIAEKNRTSTVILTGTIHSCAAKRAGSYKCNVQVWRVIKGEEDVEEIATGENNFSSTYTSNWFVDVYGIGNKEFCNSKIALRETKILFMNRIRNKLVLSSSVVHITMQNLEDVQAVADGLTIKERPQKSRDQCLDILCGYGA